MKAALLRWYIDWLVQERRNSIANAQELRLSCTNPSIWNVIHRPQCHSSTRFTFCNFIDNNPVGGCYRENNHRHTRVCISWCRFKNIGRHLTGTLFLCWTSSSSNQLWFYIGHHPPPTNFVSMLAILLLQPTLFLFWTSSSSNQLWIYVGHSPSPTNFVSILVIILLQPTLFLCWPDSSNQLCFYCGQHPPPNNFVSMLAILLPQPTLFLCWPPSSSNQSCFYVCHPPPLTNVVSMLAILLL